MTTNIKHSKTPSSGIFRMVALKNHKSPLFRQTRLKIPYAQPHCKVDAHLKSAVTMGNPEAETKFLTTWLFSKRDQTEWRRVEFNEALNMVK